MLKLASPALVLMTASAVPVAAQTNDHLYRSWRWSPVLGSPRADGLAGAFVAVADDASSVAINPAGMLLLPKSEIAASVYGVPSGTVGAGDRRQSIAGIGFIGGSGRLTTRLAIGGYFTQPQKTRLALEPLDLPDGALYEGSLEATVTEGGGAVAYRLAPRLAVGLRVTATHLELEGVYTRSGSAALGDVESGSAAGDTRVTGSFGLLYGGLDDRFRFGFAAHTGASYTVTRTANDPRIGGIDAGSEYEVRQPASLRAGVMFIPSPRFSLTGQVQLVRYSEIHAFRRPGTVEDGTYEAEDALEPSLGAEFSQPLGGWSVQFRGGVSVARPGALAYAGPDAAEVAAFRGASRETLVSVGASLLQRAGLALDLAATFGGPAPHYVAGGRVRF